MTKKTEKESRRGFLKTTTTAAAGIAAVSNIARTANAQGSDEIRFAVIGCGGRGTGAAANIMNTKGNVKLVAVADAFGTKAKNAIRQLSKKYPDKVDVPEDRIFTGIDGFKGAIDVDCDLVVIATPPAFKPMQFEYAAEKGRHIFCEKPVASDAVGVRRFMDAVEVTKKKNLLVGIGLQRRHEPQYMETVKQIHQGAIGDVIALRVYWNGGGIWHRGRNALNNLLPAGMEPTEMAYQCNNWYHFNWLCGDQICEQHIHNLDVGCWVKGEYPVECNGMGGRERRMDGDATKSQIFDHTFCEYTFSDGTKMWSQGRHLGNSWTNVSEYVHGSKGTADPSGKIFGPNAYTFTGQRKGGHQQEQHDLIEALMEGRIYNEGEYGAKSTFTAILGREACYSAKVIKWDDLWKKGKELAPGIDSYTLETDPPTMPGPDGAYPHPVPGKYNPFA
ncbi:MAG: Gfo/Idh/MocA family oxidoreductase [Planctomycetota bacterium]|nr:Gfo/Idh/MocA family oxidoreductase [Planctomycetota bacterium]